MGIGNNNDLLDLKHAAMSAAGDMLLLAGNPVIQAYLKEKNNIAYSPDRIISAARTLYALAEKIPLSKKEPK